jgi:hypothetical protein
MKIKYLYIFLILVCGLVSCNSDKNTVKNIESINKSKNKISNDLGKNWLFNFYTDYINFYINSPNRKDKSKLPLFFKQLDSIKKENCTENFLKYQQEDFIKDFDFITNNEFICEQSLESLVINKKKGVNDIYIVSFIAEYPLNESNSEYKKISFDVTIVNDNGTYKISKTCCF